MGRSSGSDRILTDVLQRGAALVLGAEGEVLAHRPSLPRPFLDNRPLVGRSIRELGPPALGNCLHRLWNACRESGQSANAELVIDLSTSSSSQAVTLSFRVAPHHASQDVWVVTVRDLTRERDRAQMLLNDLDAVRAQRDHWESTARATAHDVRSSLAAMTGFIKLALGPSGGFSPEAVAHLERALEAASRIRSMTERVLHGEKAEIGPAECVHIPPLGQRLFHSLRAAHPDVPFTWCVEAGDEFAAMRSDTLWEVLWNLLSNSVAYRSPARTLHLELRAWRAGTEVWIEVRDNGRGLARGEEEAIFLYRRRGSFSEGTEGSGLGLFSARRLIESCGGRVWATPTADGATFVVAAPAWVT